MGRGAAEVVDIEGVRFAWPGADGRRRDGDAASPQRQFRIDVAGFRMAPGERLLLLGASGSGKSTLLGLIAGIVAPDAGRIGILGTDIARLGAAARDRFRAEHIGVIFQMFNLLPYGSVLDNVLLPLAFAPERAARVAARGGGDGEATRLLQRLGLDKADIAQRTAARLSVGQQQRVAVARALIGTPELVIADEPTSALDADRRDAFLALTFGEIEAAGSALLMVSHDAAIAVRFDRVVQLADLIAAAEVVA